MLKAYWIASACVSPETRFTQEQCFKLAGYDRAPRALREQIGAIFHGAGIESRGFSIRGPRDLVPSKDPDVLHGRYVSGVRDLAPRAIREALTRAQVRADEVDLLIFASCTGLTTPGFAIELAVSEGLRSDAAVANILGMGCSALVPSLARATDFVRAHPSTRALVVATEICSSTYFIDQSIETVVGNALFGDGAAAILVSSDPRDVRSAGAGEVRGLIRGFKTLRDGRFLDQMGFTQKEGHLRVRLSRHVPENILPMVIQAREALDLPVSARVAIHPGGKKILDALAETGAAVDPIQWSRSVLRAHGNMSSPTVAFVLEESLRARALDPLGEECGMLTMGPGFSVESMRLRLASGDGARALVD